jgi:hypothetical protein
MQIKVFKILLLDKTPYNPIEKTAAPRDKYFVKGDTCKTVNNQKVTKQKAITKYCIHCEIAEEDFKVEYFSVFYFF